MTTPDEPLQNDQVLESPDIIIEPIEMARATSLVEVVEPEAEQNAEIIQIPEITEETVVAGLMQESTAIVDSSENDQVTTEVKELQTEAELIIRSPKNEEAKVSPKQD